MSTSPFDPPGIDAAGRSKLVFVRTIADLSAPTVAEIRSGTELSCALYAFVPASEQSTLERTKYCYTQTRQTLGRVTTTIEALEYDYNPQDLSAAGYGYYAALEPGVSGYIVDRRGLDVPVDWAEDQIVDIYPITLGVRTRIAVDATAEGEKLRTKQAVAVTGQVRLDVQVAA